MEFASKTTSQTLVDSPATLLCEGTTFECSRLKLAEESPFFKAMFYGQMKESWSDDVIPIHDVDANALKTLIAYCRTKKFAVTSENAIEMLQASALLQFDCVRDECIKLIGSNLDVSNCLNVMCVGDFFGIKKLYQTALSFALFKFNSVRRRPEILDLEKERLIKYLSNSGLNAKTEMIVFECLKRWVLHDKPNRQQYLLDLLQVVRFGRLSLKDVDSILQCELIKGSNAFEFVRRIQDYKNDCNSVSGNSCCSLAKTFTEVDRRTFPVSCIIFAYSIGNVQCVFSPTMGMNYYNIETNSFFRGVTGQVCKKVDTCSTIVGLEDLFAIGFRIIAAVGPVLYLLGGTSTVWSIWSYDLLLEQCTFRTNMPIRDLDLNQKFCVLDEYIYTVVGLCHFGCTQPGTYRFNTEKDTWECLAPPPPKPLKTVELVSHDGCIYLLSVRVYCYNPETDVWLIDQRGKLPKEKGGFLALSHDTGIYFIGKVSLLLYVYHPACDHIEQSAMYTVLGRFVNYSASACVVGNKIYFFDCTSIASVEVYDIVKDEVTVDGDSALRKRLTAVDLDSKSRAEEAKYFLRNCTTICGCFAIPYYNL